MALILVADDEGPIRAVVGRILRANGHDVVEAANGLEACRMAREHEVDLAIIDVVMPEKGGMDAIVDMHRDCKGLKMIVMSGKVNVDSTAFQVFTKQFGVSRILDKPFGAEALIDAVDSALSQ